MSTTKALARHLQHLANSQTEEVADAMSRAADLIYEQDSALRTQHALLERARDALNGVNNIVRDSRGVAGYHMNGDTAEWDDFDEVDAAEQALAAITQHLEPKP